MAEFRMPSLGADMESGTLVEWKMKPGDSIKKGDIIAVVETAKGVVEIEVFDAGILDELHVQPGQEIPVDQLLATICSPAELAAKKAAQVPAPAAPAAPPPAPAAAPLEAVKMAETVTVEAPKQDNGGDRARVSPLARRIAAELKVDLSRSTAPVQVEQSSASTSRMPPG